MNTTTKPCAAEIVARIRQAVAALCPEIECHDSMGFMRFNLPGYTNPVTVSMRVQYSGGGFRVQRTEKFRLALTTGFGREQFPPKKDGTHSYEKLAKRIVSIAKNRAEAEDAARAAKARVDANPVKADEWTALLRLDRFGLVKLEPSAHMGQLTVRVGTVSTTTTPEKLEAFIDAARAIGFRV